MLARTIMSKLTAQSSKQLLDSVNTVFFDCDGVLWHHEKEIGGAVQTLEKLREMNKQVIFVTNNATHSRDSYMAKFARFNIKVNKDEIYSSAYALALYMKEVVQVKKVFVMANPGVFEELQEQQIECVTHQRSPKTTFISNEFMASFKKESGIEAVVVGFDRDFGMETVAAVMQYAKGSDIPFVATNADVAFPMGNGLFCPGTGVVVNAMATACEREPVIVGKPNPLMFEMAARKFDIKTEESLMVGDRLDTDVMFGNGCSMKTLCVLTGVTDEQLVQTTLKGSDDQMKPTFYAEKVSDLLLGAT